MSLAQESTVLKYNLKTKHLVYKLSARLVSENKSSVHII